MNMKWLLLAVSITMSPQLLADYGQPARDQGQGSGEASKADSRKVNRPSPRDLEKMSRQERADQIKSLEEARKSGDEQ